MSTAQRPSAVTPDGAQPARLRPDELILPGRDASTLVMAWFARKSVYAASGLAMLLAAIHHQRDVGWGFDSPAAIVALAGVVLRLTSRAVGSVLAYRLTFSYESALDARTGVAAPVTKWLDRRQLAKGFRELRWTHHVRQVAYDRLGDTGHRLRRVELVIDIANVTLNVVGGLALLTLTSA